MTEKKTATKKVACAAPKAAKDVKEAPAKCATKKCGRKPAAKSADYVNAESAGFRAGDVYQALASAGKSLTVAEIAKAAKISKEQALLGLGWLFKEGKVKGENVADICLA